MVIRVSLSPAELAERGTPYLPVNPDSPLVTHIGHARHYGTDRRTVTEPSIIVLHTTESPNATVAGSLQFDGYRSTTVSAHYFIGEQGIGQGVSELARAFTQSRWNDVALGLEIIGAAAWSAAQWRTRPNTLANLAALLADISTRRRIPLRWLTAAEVLAGERGVCDHITANAAAVLETPARKGQHGYTHWDIGPGLRSIVPSLLTPLTTTTPPSSPPATTTKGTPRMEWIYRHPRYHNVWLCSSAGAIHIESGILTAARSRGIPEVVTDHAQTFASVCALSRTDATMLVPV